jgi:hypothetical protein
VVAELSATNARREIGRGVIWGLLVFLGVKVFMSELMPLYWSPIPSKWVQG